MTLQRKLRALSVSTCTVLQATIHVASFDEERTIMPVCGHQNATKPRNTPREAPREWLPAHERPLAAVSWTSTWLAITLQVLNRPELHLFCRSSEKVLTAMGSGIGFPYLICTDHISEHGSITSLLCPRFGDSKQVSRLCDWLSLLGLQSRGRITQAQGSSRCTHAGQVCRCLALHYSLLARPSHSPLAALVDTFTKTSAAHSKSSMSRYTCPLIRTHHAPPYHIVAMFV
jgi:hypothetical protein